MLWIFLCPVTVRVSLLAPTGYIKVEEGLQVAKIMFVFVTENSISSGWIYFEAGYAYSNGIQVIPVGIGLYMLAGEAAEEN